MFLERANRGGEFFFDEDKAVQRASEATRSLLTEEKPSSLCVSRGTLNEHERQIINSHIQVTIDMLESLKFPESSSVCRSMPAAIMKKWMVRVFPGTYLQTDVCSRSNHGDYGYFEALDLKRSPYKEPMRLSQALSIMQHVKNDHHIDPDLYALFIEAGVAGLRRTGASAPAVGCAGCVDLPFSVLAYFSMLQTGEFLRHRL